MVYGENARKHLHHSVGFECKSTKEGISSYDILEKYLAIRGHECYTPNMPEDYNACEISFINWGIGSEVNYM